MIIWFDKINIEVERNQINLKPLKISFFHEFASL